MRKGSLHIGSLYQTCKISFHLQCEYCLKKIVVLEGGYSPIGYQNTAIITISLFAYPELYPILQNTVFSKAVLWHLISYTELWLRGTKPHQYVHPDIKAQLNAAQQQVSTLTHPPHPSQTHSCTTYIWYSNYCCTNLCDGGKAMHWLKIHLKTKKTELDYFHKVMLQAH